MRTFTAHNAALHEKWTIDWTRTANGISHFGHIESYFIPLSYICIAIMILFPFLFFLYRNYCLWNAITSNIIEDNKFSYFHMCDMLCVLCFRSSNLLLSAVHMPERLFSFYISLNFFVLALSVVVCTQMKLWVIRFIFVSVALSSSEISQHLSTFWMYEFVVKRKTHEICLRMQNSVLFILYNDHFNRIIQLTDGENSVRDSAGVWQSEKGRDRWWEFYRTI